MRESRPYGSVRGARGNSRPYRVVPAPDPGLSRSSRAAWKRSPKGPSLRICRAIGRGDFSTVLGVDPEMVPGIELPAEPGAPMPLSRSGNLA